LLKNLKERYHLEDLALDGLIILKWTFIEQDRMAWTALIWLRVGMSDICKQDNEPWVS
jgi:hypothetical protein